MKKLCTSCNYIYDESIWDKEEDIDIWTVIEKCPVCQEYDTFQGIEEEINYAEDEENLNMLEIEHFPIFNFTENILEVRVWRESHPMWAEHRVASIWLYDEYWDLIEEDFFREDDESIRKFDISDLDSWEVRIKCSIHWIWARKFDLS